MKKNNKLKNLLNDNQDEELPLIIACENEYPSVIRCLIEHGADVNIESKYNNFTPLRIACKKTKK